MSSRHILALILIWYSAIKIHHIWRRHCVYDDCSCCICATTWYHWRIWWNCWLDSIAVPRNAPRRSPRYSRQICGIFSTEQMKNSLAQTTVSKVGIVGSNQTFWKCLEVLQNTKNQGGQPPPPQRHRYADCNARILRIMDDYQNRHRIVV